MKLNEPLGNNAELFGKYMKLYTNQAVYLPTPDKAKKFFTSPGLSGVGKCNICSHGTQRKDITVELLY